MQQNNSPTGKAMLAAMQKQKQQHEKRGERITLYCLFGNIALCALKLLAGIIGNSAAMVADAIHSGADVLATIAVYFGLLIAKKPSDDNHPYGHGKIEPIMSLFVGATLLFAVYSIVRGTVNSMITGQFATPSLLAAAAALISIAVKETMYRVTVGIGKKLNSESIIANAWDHRSDAYSSIGTLAGISASIIGGHLGIEFLRYMDPVTGLIVACVIFKITLHILSGAVHSLMDSAPERTVLEQITAAACATPGVKKADEIKARFVGRNIFAEIIIEVASDISVEAGHNIATAARENILLRVESMGDVTIHVEPEGFSAADNEDNSPRH